jgi:hypothetical protein
MANVDLSRLPLLYRLAVRLGLLRLVPVPVPVRRTPPPRRSPRR